MAIVGSFPFACVLIGRVPVFTIGAFDLSADFGCNGIQLYHKSRA
jgi:hypothetical protein